MEYGFLLAGALMGLGFGGGLVLSVVHFLYTWAPSPASSSQTSGQAKTDPLALAPTLCVAG